jgi:hypothetical protein
VYATLLTLSFLRQVRLYEPTQSKFLYVPKKASGINAQGNISPVECETVDFEAFPLVREAR